MVPGLAVEGLGQSVEVAALAQLKAWVGLQLCLPLRAEEFSAWPWMDQMPAFPTRCLRACLPLCLLAFLPATGTWDSGLDLELGIWINF